MIVAAAALVQWRSSDAAGMTGNRSRRGRAKHSLVVTSLAGCSLSLFPTVARLRHARKGRVPKRTDHSCEAFRSGQAVYNRDLNRKPWRLDSFEEGSGIYQASGPWKVTMVLTGGGNRTQVSVFQPRYRG